LPLAVATMALSVLSTLKLPTSWTVSSARSDSFSFDIKAPISDMLETADCVWVLCSWTRLIGPRLAEISPEMIDSVSIPEPTPPKVMVGIFDLPARSELACVSARGERSGHPELEPLAAGRFTKSCANAGVPEQYAQRGGPFCRSRLGSRCCSCMSAPTHRGQLQRSGA
jgi:hypothetical protein